LLSAVGVKLSSLLSPRRFVVVALALLAIASAASGYLLWAAAAEASRDAAAFTLSTGAQSTTLFDGQDREAFTLYIEQRTDVPLARVSPLLVQAVLTAEDRRFFQHAGFDPGRVIGAAIANARAGRIVQGGSTITQQLVRMSDGERARSYGRKLREVLLARAVERRFSKDAILATYLNKVYLGEGFYGVETAARGYFGKSAAGVTVEEAATLAALIQSPVRYTQEAYATRVLARRNWILDEMFEQHLVPEPEYRAATAAPLRVSPLAPATFAAPAEASGLYFKEAVRQQLMALLPASQVLAGGLRVFTTIDMSMQAAAEQAVRDRLIALERANARAAADPLQGSLVALDPQTGYVKALVGGRSFTESPFDRALQAHRQPGSAFKPLVYTSALEMGLEPGMLLRDLDQPILITAAGASAARGARGMYLPRDTHEAREMTLRDGLVLSSNRAAVHLQQQVGLISVLDYAQRLGVTSHLPEVPSLALGSGEVTLLELTSAYAVFANQGIRVNPILIRRVESSTGEVLFRADAQRHRVIREETAFLMTSMLSDVLVRGTGTDVRRGGFKQPAAGKTGTTNGFADAWFIGYTPRLATGVWIGHDDPHQIRKGGFAAVVAVPAWTAFMKNATQGERGEPFAQPANIEPVRYCRLSGLRAGPDCDTYLDLARVDESGAICTLAHNTDHNRGTGRGTITVANADGSVRTIHIGRAPTSSPSSQPLPSGGALPQQMHGRVHD
jgi:1A family penicillin-binding protein